MTRRDFTLIANIISDLPNVDDDNRRLIAELFAVRLKETNVNFDTERFVALATK